MRRTMVGRDGIEPPTPGFQFSPLIGCSLRLFNDLLTRGLAPTVTRRCGRLRSVTRSE